MTKPKPKGTTETDKPVCRFFLKPDGCKNGDARQYAHPAPMGSVYGVAWRRIISRLVPVLADSSLLDPAVQSRPQRRCILRAQDKKKAKGKSKGKDRKAKPAAKSGEVDFDENAQADHDEPEEPQGQDDDQEEDPEA